MWGYHQPPVTDFQRRDGLDPTNDNPDFPGPAGIVPLVFQDLLFEENGELCFLNVGTNPEHPFWIPEFMGDVFVVN